MTHPPSPTTAPRAPIVWHDSRDEITPHTLEAVGPGMASTKTRALASARGERPPRLEGQLWQRLAEREVATYGEGVKCAACGGWGVVSVMQHDGNEDTYSCLDCGSSGEVITIGDVKRRGPLVIRMEEAQARRIIAAEIEGRRALRLRQTVAHDPGCCCATHGSLCCRRRPLS